MIVERYTLIVKNGKWDEALDLFKEGRRIFGLSFPAEFTLVTTANVNTLVIDNEFKDMAEHDKLWEQLAAKEEWPQFMAKMNELTTEQGSHTLWTLE